MINVPIKNIPALVKIMAWSRPGDKPLSEPITISLLTYMFITRPQWVNSLWPSDSIWWTGSTLAQVQSTPVISRLLGAKICERELSSYLRLSREATTCDLQGHRPTYMTYSGVYKSQTVCWAIIEVLTFPGSLHTSTSHQRPITTSNIRS